MENLMKLCSMSDWSKSENKVQQVHLVCRRRRSDILKQGKAINLLSLSEAWHLAFRTRSHRVEQPMRRVCS